MVEDANKKIDEAKERIRKKQERRAAVKLAGVVTGIMATIATISAPKTILKNELNDTREETTELLDLKAKETQHQTVHYECLCNNAKEILEHNGYSFAVPENTKEGVYKYDILDKNNETVGIVNALHFGEKPIFTDLTVLKDSSLMDLLEKQSENDFKKQREGTISFIQGERITQAFNRHDRIENLQRKEKHLKETITGVREINMGTD